MKTESIILLIFFNKSSLKRLLIIVDSVDYVILLELIYQVEGYSSYKILKFFGKTMTCGIQVFHCVYPIETAIHNT